MKTHFDTPILQVALDFLNLRRAVNVAKEAVSAGVDWIEVGTPLIKSEGLNAVRVLRKEFPSITIVADMKTMDAGRIEVESAAKAGANVSVVMGEASEETIRECVRAGRNYGVKIWVDFLTQTDFADRAIVAEELGADFIGVHTPIDDQMRGMLPFENLRQVCTKVGIPVSVAGGINSETAVEAVNAGASIVVVGGAICKAANINAAVVDIKRALYDKRKVPVNLYKRVTDTDVYDVLEKVSTANISDGGHRLKGISDLRCLNEKVKMVGRAFTVRTYPGDWAKPVEAIDRAEKGSVIVIDSGGSGPAVWGELATQSAIQRGIAGVVVNGAVRDSSEIRKLKFPTFTKFVMPNAGEPKGFGEMEVPVTISGVRIKSGDWIVGDEDGLIVVPKQKAREMANLAMDCCERENRLREEILGNKTSLGEVIELLRWEKR
ncbi:MAG: bifunctional hexulose-6-phosphate synthase/ribonuclease regulator [Candidatus Scalindua sp. AMX11]|nr:MAG: bifunctional hexulose-6-phosphate synthase/ribonuclease regulator [Candidatus Scalindua sp.]NOG82329.1 bifunctional hexulose-6-phosphate synthase/ribonuclease regulator [Planctomycetota bacterium]RZV66896.1 MAG: bifunctional hexulose-6-phosphate synthase/ribonuclease regulator [Candidatus Scalindua sp. SCAELEC01]TDE63189.1 MAG: bifunctional hexulose-6-phosphate synthase/ribonuclease regulator [Candidatus Scalindua sp. AMX11]GJQ60533.1 MAG: (Fe-S)-cluster assembly protein [Candidatus Sca